MANRPVFHNICFLPQRNYNISMGKCCQVASQFKSKTETENGNDICYFSVSVKRVVCNGYKSAFVCAHNHLYFCLFILKYKCRKLPIAICNLQSVLSLTFIPFYLLKLSKIIIIFFGFTTQRQ